uniref:Uncharacterized protein n=1 Tax=Candidatus Kentrum sp. FW TaxID=2126338 RepID=A0A450TGL4_9GAMM|nr:MAG: hypothetical protein BECKFW1821C_GA0114237_100942 [Candidatus Kentron sp. FW]
MSYARSLSAGGLALFLIHLGVAVQADGLVLGRLFFSGEERRELDRVRDGYERQKAPIARKEQNQPSPESFTINGVVMRSNGSNTFWINGAPVSEDDASRTGIYVIEQSNDTVEIGVSRGSDGIRLKPGQKVIFRGSNVSDIR